MLGKFNRLLPRLSTLAKQSKSPFATAGGKDLSARNVDRSVARRERLQFSKDRLTEFGDLPVGEIPEALKYDRETQTSQLSNGIRVATQQWSGQLATISVYIKAGSRQETLENSGVSHFLQNLNLRGTKNRTRSQLETEFGSLGAALEAQTTRETTNYSLTVSKKDTARAVELLGDVLTNSQYDKNQVEAEREAVYRECIETSKDQLEATVEASHYTAFRDHILGQPVRGNRDNIGNITADQISDFHKANYVGSNIVVVGAGDITHQQLVDAVEKHLGNLPGSAQSGVELKNNDQAYFTPSLMLMRDDEQVNVNIGSFFRAPGWTHEDHFSFVLFEKLLGEYRQNVHGAHLNSSERQYNTLHSLLGQLADITVQKTFYLPYSDTGLFGSYIHGNEVHANQMLYVSQLVASDWANSLNQVEVFRAKNKLYNTLLREQETGTEVARSLGNQLLFLNRVVPRSETATRISNIEQAHLTRVAREWFFDTDIACVAWGPIHGLMALSHYNRPLRRSTLGWYGDAHYHIH